MKLGEAIASVSKDNQERYIRAFSPEAIYTLLKYIRASRELVKCSELLLTNMYYRDWDRENVCWECSRVMGSGHERGCWVQDVENALANIKKLEG